MGRKRPTNKRKTSNTLIGAQNGDDGADRNDRPRIHGLQHSVYIANLLQVLQIPTYELHCARSQHGRDDGLNQTASQRSGNGDDRVEGLEEQGRERREEHVRSRDCGVLPVGGYASCASRTLTRLWIHADHLHDDLSHVVALRLTPAFQCDIEREGEAECNGDE